MIKKKLSNKIILPYIKVRVVTERVTIDASSNCGCCVTIKLLSSDSKYYIEMYTIDTCKKHVKYMKAVNIIREKLSNLDRLNFLEYWSDKSKELLNLIFEQERDEKILSDISEAMK